jgi:uncharacterized BrkB/YihY/UPF0761 family membrane protein
MIREILRHVLKRYDKINGPLLAKGLGFSLILGLLPLVFLALSAGAYLVNITPEVYESMLQGLADYIPADLLENYLARVVDFSRNWRSLSLFTLGFFLIFLSICSMPSAGYSGPFFPGSGVRFPATT